MAALLLLITSQDDTELMLSIGADLSRRLEFQFMVAPCPERSKQTEMLLQETEAMLLPWEKDLFRTIYSSIDAPEHDISLIVISPNGIQLNKRNRATTFFAKFRSLKIPYLVMPDSPTSQWHPQKIIFPLCLKDGEKEASAWAGFCARATRSDLIMVYPQFHNKTTSNYLQRNLGFVRNLFNKSEVAYQELVVGHKRKEVRIKTIELAGTFPGSLLVMPATRLNSPEYVFTGPPEIRLLKNRGNTPVLFVNPRHDLFLPCS